MTTQAIPDIHAEVLAAIQKDAELIADLMQLKAVALEKRQKKNAMEKREAFKVGDGDLRASLDDAVMKARSAQEKKNALAQGPYDVALAKYNQELAIALGEFNKKQDEARAEYDRRLADLTRVSDLEVAQATADAHRAERDAAVKQTTIDKHRQGVQTKLGLDLSKILK